MAWHHPGKALDQLFLQPRGLSQNRIDHAIGVPPRRINEIVLGKRAISADTAVRLARFFDNEPAYWMKLQTDYDIALATNRIGIKIYAIQAHQTDQPKPGTEPAQPTARQNSHKNQKQINHTIRRRLLRSS